MAERKGPRTAAVAFVFVTVLLDAIGFGIIMPVMPDLMAELAATDIAGAALWGGYLAFVYAVMQFLFGPVVGNLSDRFGRRPVLLASLATLTVDYLVMGATGSLWLLFLARAMAGIAGATYSTAHAYIADVSPKESRAANFGMIGAAFGLGFVLGPAIGGLMGEIGVRAPFYAAAALAAANFVYGWVVLPESLPPEKRRAFDWRRANPLGAVRQAAKLPMLVWFLVAYFLFNLAHYVYPSVWAYFTKEAFAWSNAEVGLSLAAVGACMAVVQGLLIRVILKRFREVRTVLIGFAANIVCMTGIALATEGWMIYALMPATALGVIVGPALSGLMANLVPDDAQGELQGVLASISGVTTILSPVFMTQAFGFFSGGGAWVYFPGAPFVAAAALIALAAWPFLRGLRAVGAHGA